MNVEQLRKQAKELVRAARGGDEEAVARFEGRPVKLASAQLVLAREYGYPSWPALVHAADATAEAFVLAATDGRRERADALLRARPEIAEDPWAALVLGRGWDRDPNEPGGPRRWAPLHYVCHSPFAGVDLARDLLGRGADPNAFYANEYGPMSALYGAAGVRHDVELTRLLLENGADPNAEAQFGDALYHSVESESTDCTRVLLEYGARVPGSNAIAHALDFDHRAHVRLLLDSGGDADEGALLVHAVRRGCELETIRLLAARGAPLDKRGGEWSTPRERRKTAYQNAVLRRRDDVAALLVELGASTELEPDDEAVAALLRGERVDLPADLSPDAQEALIGAVLDGRDDVLEVVGASFFGHAGGGPPGTLLHYAAWVGDAELAAKLLARGADPNASSGAEFDTPAAWCALGSRHARGRDRVGAMDRLVTAGAELETRFLDVAEGPLREWLEERI